MTTPTIYLTPLPDAHHLPRRELERQALQSLTTGGLLPELPRGTILHYRPNGAPLLPSHLQLGISISHSTHLLALALFPLGMQVGIDIEEEWAQAAKLIHRVASQSELQLLQEARLPEVLLWSAKEATFKAHSGLLEVFSKQIELTALVPEQQQLQLTVKPKEQQPFAQVVSYQKLTMPQMEQRSAILTCTTTELPPLHFLNLPQA